MQLYFLWRIFHQWKRPKRIEGYFNWFLSGLDQKPKCLRASIFGTWIKSFSKLSFMDLRKSGITQSSRCRSLVLQEKETRNLCRGTLEICLKVKNSIVFSALKVVKMNGSQNIGPRFVLDRWCYGADSTLPCSMEPFWQKCEQIEFTVKWIRLFRWKLERYSFVLPWLQR